MDPIRLVHASNVSSVIDVMNVRPPHAPFVDDTGSCIVGHASIAFASVDGNVSGALSTASKIVS
jgi:hypothetical protein